MIFAPLGKLRLSERRLFAPHLTTVDPLASFREGKLSDIHISAWEWGFRRAFERSADFPEAVEI